MQRALFRSTATDAVYDIVISNASKTPAVGASGDLLTRRKRDSSASSTIKQSHRTRVDGQFDQMIVDRCRWMQPAHAALAAELSDRLVHRDASDPPQLDELSPRELAVLRYLPTMLTNREIASELTISVNTVKTHVKSIYLKLGARDRRDAVRRARRAGLLAMLP